MFIVNLGEQAIIPFFKRSPSKMKEILLSNVVDTALDDYMPIIIHGIEYGRRTPAKTECIFITQYIGQELSDYLMSDHCSFKGLGSYQTGLLKIFSTEEKAKAYGQKRYEELLEKSKSDYKDRLVQKNKHKQHSKVEDVEDESSQLSETDFNHPVEDDIRNVIESYERKAMVDTVKPYWSNNRLLIAA